MWITMWCIPMIPMFIQALQSQPRPCEAFPSFPVDSESPQGSAPRCWLSLAWQQTWRLAAFPRWCRCETSAKCATHTNLMQDIYIYDIQCFTAAESGGIFLASIHGTSDFCRSLNTSVDADFSLTANLLIHAFFTTFTSHLVASQGAAPVLVILLLASCNCVELSWLCGLSMTVEAKQIHPGTWRQSGATWKGANRCFCLWQEVRIHVCNLMRVVSRAVFLNVVLQEFASCTPAYFTLKHRWVLIWRETSWRRVANFEVIM